MILFYASNITERLKYTTTYVFETVLKTEVKLCSNLYEYDTYNGIRINYSNEKNEGITIRPHSLLFEDSIRKIEIPVSKYQSKPILFSNKIESSLPFDPFAAIFFMISRYEEYLPHASDEHERFQYLHSIAYQYGFLEIPIVDYWAEMVKSIILHHYPDCHFPKRTYNFVPTIDVDIAWAYRNRSLLRNIGSFGKSIVKLNFRDIKNRIGSLFFGIPDPYDTFRFIDEIHLKHKPIYFFQIGKFGKYDKNISIRNKSMKNLISQVSKTNEIGIHPSYQSNYSKVVLAQEMALFRALTHEKNSKSRQHYLILKFPETYKNLVELGVSADYTMGYADHIGFRAGTCTPFQFFDLSTNTQTKLKIVPFQIMDGTLRYYEKLQPLDAIARIEKIITEIKTVNGTFVSLWHNTTLSEMHEWQNWREVYQVLLKIAE